MGLTEFKSVMWELKNCAHNYTAMRNSVTYC